MTLVDELRAAGVRVIEVRHSGEPERVAAAIAGLGTQAEFLHDQQASRKERT